MNAGIRYIYNIRRDTHITPYRSELGWLKACDWRKYFLGCFTFRILNTQRPLYFYQALSEQFIPLRQSEHLQSLSINIPAAFSEIYKNSFLITALELWFMLPSDILNASSFYIFSNIFLSIWRHHSNGHCDKDKDTLFLIVYFQISIWKTYKL